MVIKMNSIRILDCTLRDGGYCNQWKFGSANIRKVIQNLTDAGIEIIECGFLSNKVENNPDISKFRTISYLSEVLPSNRHGCIYVAMINYGEYDLDEIPDCDGTTIDGIRVAFHKKNAEAAMPYCKKLMDKGYKVFVQAMVSMAYSDIEFLNLIHSVNELNPYAFYIVDSFGMMKEKDLMRYFALIENNLNFGICVGFHSHNNMQLAYSNAQSMVEAQTNRDLIVDSSIYGMGRGAGNLNTELFVEYLNNRFNKNYSLKLILEMMDEIINRFYRLSPWGYSLPNYLSARHNTHPNYAGYLADRNTLTVGDMDEIFELMDEDKRVEFDKSYIESLYLHYMERGKIIETNQSEFKELITKREILLIGPAKSSETQADLIKEYVKTNNPLVISVNFDYSTISPDYIFISNLRRFREISQNSKSKFIVTSNIPAADVYMQIKYQDVLNDIEVVRDNAGLMAVKMLINMGVSTVALAGFDGYSHDVTEGYADKQMAVIRKNAMIDAMNSGMGEIFRIYAKSIKMNFITPPVYYSV